MSPLLKKSLVFVLAFNLVFPATLFAKTNVRPDANAAAGKRPTMASAPNGVPLVNIADPSKSGLSHNQYSDFSVGKQGVILNNSNKDAASQLGGIVLKNPNLKSGPAKTILNEVTGASRSNIQGYIEVHGQKADVILANPNGVTINGGGFINTGRATVTTGRPDVDAAGKLRGFDVRQGDVRIEGSGINASNLTGFDIVSRAAEINAEIYAQDLTIITGQNRYDPTTRTATPLADDGSEKPKVAIDSTALGGMYAGRITLTSNEKGVGVNLQGVMQSTGDLAISSDGKLVLQAAKADANMKLASASGDVRIQRAAVAGGNLTASGKNIDLRESSAFAGKNLELRAAENVALSGDNSYAAAEGTLKLQAASANLEKGAAMAASNLDLTLSDNLDVSQNSSLAAQNNAEIKAGSIRLQDASLAAGSELDINAKQISLADSSVAADKAVIAADDQMIVAGESFLQGESSASIKADYLSVADGAVLSGGILSLNAAKELKIYKARAQALEQLNLTAGALNNDGLVYSDAGMNILAGFFKNTGEVSAAGNIKIKAESFENNRGKVLANNDLSIRAASLLNQGDSLADLNALNLDRVIGLIYAGSALELAGSNLSFNGGLIGSDARLDLESAKLSFSPKSALYSGGQARLRTGGNLAFNQVNLSVGGDLELAANNLTLAKATILAGGEFTAELKSNLSVDAASTLAGYSGLEIYSENLTNHGLIYSGADAAFNIKNTLSNLNGADILAEGNLVFAGRSAGSRLVYLHNSASGIESLQGGINISADKLFNDGGSATFSRVADGYDYIIFGWHGDFTGRYSDDTGAYHPELVTPYDAEFAYSPEGDKNYLTERYKLNKKSGDRTLAYLAEQERVYGLPADTLGTKYEGFQEWKEYYYDKLESAPDRASIMAAGNMILNVGELINSLSTISAGGSLSLTADKLTNKGVELSRYTEIERYFISTGSKGSYEVSGKSGYYTLAEVYDSIPGIISAAGQLNLQVKKTLENSVSKSGLAYDGKAGGSPAIWGFEVTGNLDMDKLHDFDGLKSSPAVNPLPPSGVFSLSSNPKHNYLIETNPALLSLSRFYGSDYFLNLIGYDLTREQTKLLGDAYYETRLVREQMLAQAGTRYLFAGVTDDAETMRLLMDNAATEGLSLGLAVGVALSPEQIQGLNKDIVWLEEMEYNGQTVLVPRLYLCEATLADLNMRGAILAGDDVSINYSGAAPLMNSGLISGNRVQLASTADILNKGGDILGRTSLLAQSDGSIINRSGSLGGGDVFLAAGKDIVVETAMETQAVNNTTRGGTNSGYRAIMGQSADITASGNITLQAGNDINLAGGRIEGQGQTRLVAENDVTLGGTTAAFGSTSKQGYHSFTAEMGSSVSGQDVQISAGRDLTLAGSSVSATDSASLQAGHNLTVTALEGTYDSYWKQAHKGSWGKKSKEIIEQHSTGLVGSSIEAGGNLSLAAGLDSSQGKGHLTMQASQAAARGDVNLSASGDVTLANGVERDFYSYYKSSKGLFKSSLEARAHDNATSVGSLVSGENVNIRAGDNVLVAGSGVAAKNDLNVRAESGDIIVAAAQESYWSDSREAKSSFSLGNVLKAPLNLVTGKDTVIYSQIDETNKNLSVVNAGSALSAGNNLNMQAGRDVSIIGSLVEAGNDVSIMAERDVNLIPGREKEVSEHKRSKKEVGLWSSLGEGGFSLFAGVKTEKSGLNTSGDYTAGSMVAAGNDVNIQAGRNLNQAGSHIQAGQDANIDVGQDWNQTASHNYETLHQYVTTTQAGIGASVQQNVTGAVRELAKTPERASSAKGGAGYSAVTAAGEGLRAIDIVDGAITNPLSASGHLGASSSKTDYKASSSTAQPSSVTAGRDVNATAGRDINIEGSQILAGSDVVLDAGNDVNIITAKNDYSSEFNSKSNSAGLTASASLGLNNDKDFGATGSVSVGADFSKGNSSGSGTTHTGSLISAGRDVIILGGRDINVEGSEIHGKQDVILDAGRDLNIIAAVNTNQSDSSSSSGGGGIGIKGALDQNGLTPIGANITGHASGSKSTASGNTHVNSVITAGDTLYTSSGRDTTVAGAHLEADKVWMDVGGDLTVASLQDSYEAKSNSWNTGVDLTIGSGVNLGLNLGGGQGSHETAWVGEQTSIVGRSEVDIYVENNTHIKGAIIATDPGGDLILNTDTLTFEEIQDKSKGSDWSGGLSLNLDSGNKNRPGEFTPNSGEVEYASYDKAGVLRPTITDGDIIVRSNPDAETDGSLDGLNRDLDKAREITKDKEVGVGFYISDNAINEIRSGGEGIKKGINAYGEFLEDKLVSKVVDDAVASMTKEEREVFEKKVEEGQSREQAVQEALPPEKREQVKKEVASAKDTAEDYTERVKEVSNALSAEGGQPEVAAEHVKTVMETQSLDLGLQNLIDKYGSIENIPATEKQTWFEEFCKVAPKIPEAQNAVAEQRDPSKIDSFNLGIHAMGDDITDAIKSGVSDTLIKEAQSFLWLAMGGLDIQTGRYNTEAAQDLINSSAALAKTLEEDPAAFMAAAKAGLESFVNDLSSDDPYLKAKAYTNLALVIVPLTKGNSIKQITKLPANLPKKIHAGQQGKHIIGHNNFMPGRSTLNPDINAQSLLDGIHANEYKVLGVGPRGQIIVDFGKVVGKDGTTGLQT